MRRCSSCRTPIGRRGYYCADCWELVPHADRGALIRANQTERRQLLADINARLRPVAETTGDPLQAALEAACRWRQRAERAERELALLRQSDHAQT